MKKLLYCALTLFAFSQNLEVQAAERKPTKKQSSSAAPISDQAQKSIKLVESFNTQKGINELNRMITTGELDPNEIIFGSPLLIHAISRRKETVCMNLLKRDIDPNIRGPLNCQDSEKSMEATSLPPLAAAVFRDMPTVFETLLKKEKTDPNATFDKGKTPLMLLLDKLGKRTSKGKIEDDQYYKLLNLLLQNPKTKLNLRDKTGYTAFHGFCELNFKGSPHDAIQVMELLLEKGADHTIPMLEGNIPPVMTAAKKNPFMARYLLERFPELKDAIDSKEFNILHHSFFADVIDLDFITYLRQKFPNKSGNELLLFIVDNDPKSDTVLSPDLIRILNIDPRQPITVNGDENAVGILQAILLAQGKNNVVNERTIDYLTGQPTVIIPHPEHGTALHIAAKTEKPLAVELLIGKGFDPNRRGTESLVTPLMIALKHQCRKTGNYLLEKTNLQLTDKNGDTALAYAAKFYDQEILNSVLEHYQKHCPHYIQIENNEGKTAYDLLPDAVKKADQNARELIATEKKESQKLSEAETTAQKRAKIIANLERAKKEREFEAFIAEKLAIEETEYKASNPPEEKTPDPETYEIKICLTKALQKFYTLSHHRKSDPKTIEMRQFFLERQGYFSDPSKESAHDRKARAKFYQQLRTTMSDQEAQETIINNHAFPRSAIQALLDSVTDERTGITVKASYTTDKGEICEGDYEVFFVKMSDERVQVYHSLFKQKSIKKAPSKKISTVTKDTHADAASASAAAADDDFTKVGAFTSEKTESSDKVIHTITDNNTGTVYTLEIPK